MGPKEKEAHIRADLHNTRFCAAQHSLAAAKRLSRKVLASQQSKAVASNHQKTDSGKLEHSRHHD